MLIVIFMSAIVINGVVLGKRVLFVVKFFFVSIIVEFCVFWCTFFFYFDRDFDISFLFTLVSGEIDSGFVWIRYCLLGI